MVILVFLEISTVDSKEQAASTAWKSWYLKPFLLLFIIQCNQNMGFVTVVTTPYLPQNLRDFCELLELNLLSLKLEEKTSQ